MLNTCPKCGARLEPAIDAENLAQWCETRGLHVSPNGLVSESTAAAIIGKSPHTLRGYRNGGGQIPHVRTRAGVKYDLQALATYLSEIGD